VAKVKDLNHALIVTPAVINHERTVDQLSDVRPPGDDAPHAWEAGE
jgi:hypothetical protein